MKVLVTGAGGFIGNNICSLFCNNGHRVVGWDVVEKSTDYQFIKVDLLDEKTLYDRLLIDTPDIIIHCAGAADVGKSVANPFADYIRNVTITHNLLFALHRAGLINTRVIFMSSAAVYGNPEMLPISEEANLNPLSPYALHKVMCEDICRYMHSNYNMDVKILRIFSAYGEGLKKQIFWDMYVKAVNTGRLDMFGTGKESRDYINIKDLIRVIYMVAVSSPKYELIYNVANGKETTIREATECFADAIGLSCDKISFSGEEKEGNPINWRADVSKLKALGYQNSVKLDEGIANYVAWARKQK